MGLGRCRLQPMLVTVASRGCVEAPTGPHVHPTKSYTFGGLLMLEQRPATAPYSFLSVTTTTTTDVPLSLHLPLP